MAGNPPIARDEIEWRGPSGEMIGSAVGSRLTLHDTNTRLVLRTAELADSGTYRIDIVREFAFALYRIAASTTIDLNVLGKYICVYVL